MARSGDVLGIADGRADHRSGLPFIASSDFALTVASRIAPASSQIRRLGDFQIRSPNPTPHGDRHIPMPLEQRHIVRRLEYRLLNAAAKALRNTHPRARPAASAPARFNVAVHGLDHDYSIHDALQCIPRGNGQAPPHPGGQQPSTTLAIRAPLRTHGPRRVVYEHDFPVVLHSGKRLLHRVLTARAAQHDVDLHSPFGRRSMTLNESAP
jgi:hypothetical protein